MESGKQFGLGGIALGAICLIFGLALNASGTGEFGMIEGTGASARKQYLGAWLVRTDRTPDVPGTSEDPTPNYCDQTADSDNNNCPIGRANRDTECCKAWSQKCSTQKTYICLGCLLSFFSIIFGLRFVSNVRVGPNWLVPSSAGYAALSYMLGFAMWATFLDGDFFSNAATGELNTGATCGLKGVTAGGEDMDFKAGAGFVLCVLAFILSIFQTILYVLANRAVAAASA